MKTFAAVSPCPEPLEARIAPATLVSPTTVTYTDVDGDDVTVKITKGTLDLAENFVFAASGAGEQLQTLVLTAAEFANTSITITAKRSATNGGDGSVNVGYINATGNDLATVKVAGDLGQIDGGNNTPGAPELKIKLLDVASMGEFGLTTQAAGGSLESRFLGGIGSIKIRGNVREARIESEFIGIKSVFVGGSVIGGSASFSGRIEADDGFIGSVTIKGDIIGGAGFNSGQVTADKDIKSVTVGGVRDRWRRSR